jgi:predicted Ser/Thr protein kinase
MSESASAHSIDKYEVVRELGSGATSTVYLAYDAFSERQVAIKIIKEEALADAEQGAGFRRLLANEAALAGKLKHPHIMGIYDASLTSEKCYIVMEYVDGHALDEYADADTLLPVERIAEIIFKCALALDFSARNGVIHRDIKPANIMLTNDGEVKIADFGAAMMVTSDKTQLMGVGSPAYMSPEQIRLDPLNHQTDIYSLGVTMYRLLTGRAPFEADSGYALTHKILNEAAPGIRTLRPTLPSRLESIVAKAMAKECTARYTTWQDFAQDLARIVQLDLPHEVATEAERYARLKALAFFQDFGDIELWEVLRIGMWGRVPAGACLMEEGDDGDFLFIIIEGELAVTKGTKHIGVQGPGTCFGEMCYIRRQALKRTATVVATTPVTLIKIKASSLHKASEACQLKFNSAFLNVLIDRLTHADHELVRST